jgi:outer membrane receptor protein involved in Fe transport
MAREKMILKAIPLIALSLALTTAIYAQTQGNAAISGTVTDPSHAVIPRAKITVKASATGATYAVVSNAAGVYDVPTLPPGAYTISVDAPGFKTFVEHLTLLADQARAVNVELQVGSTGQKVMVTATAAMVNFVTPTLSQVVTSSSVNDLPLPTRNAAGLVLLVPGTTNANSHGSIQGSTKEDPLAYTAFSVNGTRSDQVSYNLDGADNQDILSNTNDPFPFPDATQEFSVQTSQFTAQYGYDAGAIVNVVTKSGTNQWHGDAFEYVRNPIFNARNSFETTRDPYRQNQFGGTIGGPIKKNNSFIFFGYQRTVVSDTLGGESAIVPTAANLSGDFSNYLTANPAVNPLGKVVQLKDPATGAPIPGNLLMADPNTPLNPVAENLAKELLPVSSASANGDVLFAPLEGQNDNMYVGRFDQAVRGGKDHLTYRILLDRFHQEPSFDGKDLLTIQNNFNGDGSTVQSQNHVLSYTWDKSANVVNNTYFSFLRTGSSRFTAPGAPTMATLGSNIYQIPGSGISRFSVDGYFSAETFTPATFTQNSWALRDNATWLVGAHTIGLGGDYEHDQSIIRNTNELDGNWAFDSSDFTGNALANFVTGNLYTFAQDSGNFSDQHENELGLYVQDQWRSTRRLTLDLGLRWEPQVLDREIYGRMEEFSPQAFAAGFHSKVIPSAPPGTMFIGDTFNGFTMPKSGEPGDLDNFAPRVGFALDPTGSGKTVIRGGAGIFYYSRLPGLFLNDATLIPPFDESINLFPPVPAFQGGGLSNPLAGQPAFAAAFPERYTLATVPPNVVFPSPVANDGLQFGSSWVTPAVYSWNLTVQRQLTASMVVTAAYVGNEAANLRQDQDLNPAQYFPGNTAFDALSTDRRRVYSNCSPANVVPGCTPIYSNIIVNSNSGNSNFNSLQLTWEKRPGPGLPGLFKNVTFLANYTYSKAMAELAQNGGITDISSSDGSGVPFGNPYQFAFDRGPADFNHTHTLVLSYVWPLPRLAGSSNRFAKSVLGGWDWTGIFTRQSSDVIGYNDNNAGGMAAGEDNSRTGLGNDRVNFVGNVNQLGTGAQTNATPCSPSVKFCVPFLNSALFALPPVGQFGNIGEGAIAGPGYFDYDMSLMKNFYPISSHENFSVQVRGDFINFLNHPNFGDPNVSFTGANFGQVTGYNGNPRIIQLAMKIFF